MNRPRRRPFIRRISWPGNRNEPISTATSVVSVVLAVVIVWNTLDGFHFLYGPCVLYRWIFGADANVDDFVRPSHAVLETLVWLAGILILASGSSRPRWVLAFIFALCAFPLYQLTVLVGMLALHAQKGISIVVLVLAVAHRLIPRDRAGPRLVIEMVTYLFCPVVAFSLLAWYASTLHPLGFLFSVPGGICVLLWLRWLSLTPAIRPWGAFGTTIILLASATSATLVMAHWHNELGLLDEGTRHDTCEAIRAESGDWGTWIPLEADRPFALFPLPGEPDTDLERLLVVGEETALVLEIDGRGLVTQKRHLDWPEDCTKAEHFAIDHERRIGALACVEPRFVLFDLDSMEYRGRAVDWPLHDEPQDVRMTRGRCDTLATLTMVPTVACFEPDDRSRPLLYNYRGRIGGWVQFEYSDVSRPPQYIVSSAGIHRLDPDTGDIEEIRTWMAKSIVGAVDDGDRLLVLAGIASRLYLLDARSGDLIAEARLTDGPRYAAIAGAVYAISLHFGQEVQFVSRKDLSALGSIAVGPRPRMLYWSESHQTLYGLSLCGMFAIDGDALPTELLSEPKVGVADDHPRVTLDTSSDRGPRSPAGRIHDCVSDLRRAP